MFESLERRCLFSFGFEPIIPPPVDVADAVHAGRAPELIAPVPATHEKLLIELPAAQFKSVDSPDDVVVEVQLVRLQAPPPGFMAPPPEAGMRTASGSFDTSNQDALFEALEAMGRPSFTADRSYLADDKPLANMLLDRLETSGPLRGAPMAPAEGRPQPLMTPFLNDGPHQVGTMSLRSMSVPVGIEFQRNPAEAPANSNGISDKNSPLPARLASLDAIDGNLEFSDAWGETLAGEANSGRRCVGGELRCERFAAGPERLRRRVALRRVRRRPSAGRLGVAVSLGPRPEPRR